MTRIATLNVRGIGNPDKQKYLWDFIVKNKIDILAMQEFNTNKLQIEKENYNIIINSTENNLGTAFIINKKLNILDVKKTIDNRITSIELDSIIITNIYGYTTSYPTHIRENLLHNCLPQFLRNSKKHNILLGDFNEVTDPADRSKPGRINSYFGDILVGLGLRDAYLEGKLKSRFTFHSTQGSTRIDRIYTSFEKNIKKLEYLDYTRSDHIAVVVETNPLCLEQINKKTIRTFWKMNVSILGTDFDHEFKNLHSAAIDRIKEYPSIADWWDNDYKPNVKKLAVEFCTNKKKEERCHKNFLELALKQARIEHEKQKTNQTYKDYCAIKTELNMLDKEIFKGARLRSLTKYPISDEQATVKDLISEKTSQKNRNFESLLDNQGHMQTDLAKIKNIIRNSYKEIFTLEKKHNGTSELHLENLTKKIDKTTKENMENEIEIPEIKEALFSLPDGKAPGVDGIPTEFYKYYFEILAPILIALFRENLKNKTMCKSQNTGAISLIPKNRDKTNISNWRPVSVLCADYKILSKTLVNRLKPALEQCIGHAQTGAIKNRNIADNLQTARNVVLHFSDKEIQKTKLNGAIVGLDFQKAFDRVDREWIYKVMYKFDFPTKFVEWVETLYSNPVAKIYVNGEAIQDIEMTRGIRQGCPLAALLYIIYIEPLIKTFQNNLTGIKIGPTEAKIIAYIDDIYLFINNDYDLLTIEKIIESFEVTTNSQINKNKTKILALGNWTNRKKWNPAWLQPVETMRVLGVKFRSNIRLTIKENSESLIKKTNQSIIAAAKRRLTVQQRVLYFNMYVISKIAYVAKVLPLPKKTIKTIQNAGNKFVWINRLEKLASKQIQLQPKDGGLGLVSIEKKTLALIITTNIKLLNGKEDNPNFLLFRYWTGFALRNIGKDYRKQTKEKPNKFFTQITKTIIDISQKQPDLLTRPNTKATYKHLMTEQNIIPRIHSKYPLENLKTVLANIRNWILDPIDKEHMFFQLHDILTTKQRLKKCKQILSGNCDYCGQEETLAHIYACYTSQPVMKWLIRQLKKIDTNLAEINIGKILTLNFNLTDKKKQHTALWLVSKFARAIWLARKAETHKTQLLPEIKMTIKNEIIDLKASKAYHFCQNIDI